LQSLRITDPKEEMAKELKRVHDSVSSRSKFVAWRQRKRDAFIKDHLAGTNDSDEAMPLVFMAKSEKSKLCAEPGRLATRREFHRFLGCQPEEILPFPSVEVLVSSHATYQPHSLYCHIK
jgi:hypothetical protein